MTKPLAGLDELPLFSAMMSADDEKWWYEIGLPINEEDMKDLEVDKSESRQKGRGYE